MYKRRCDGRTNRQTKWRATNETTDEIGKISEERRTRLVWHQPNKMANDGQDECAIDKPHYERKI